MDRHMHALKSTLVVPLHLLQFSRNRPRTLSRLGNRISVVLCDRPSFQGRATGTSFSNTRQVQQRNQVHIQKEMREKGRTIVGMRNAICGTCRDQLAPFCSIINCTQVTFIASRLKIQVKFLESGNQRGKNLEILKGRTECV